MRRRRVSFQDGGHGTTTERRIMTFFYAPRTPRQPGGATERNFHQ